MGRAHTTRWLSEQAQLGLRELPTNAAWLASRVNPGEVAGSAAARSRDKARKLKASLVDAAPLGDSVETRLKRAREAAERAQEAEDEALEAAQSSKESSERVRQLAEHNRAWLARVEHDATQRAEQRVAEAQRAAEERVAEAQRAAAERVEQERAAAQNDAHQELQKAQAEAAEETEAARREAEAAQHRADDLLARSRERLEEARRLAGEAEQAAVAAAEEAHRQAQQLADGTEQRAKSADKNGTAADQEANLSASGVARDKHREQTNDNLESQTKTELQHLAASLEIEGHMKMNKAELISAITKTAPNAR